jgi:hypothetical protein
LEQTTLVKGLHITQLELFGFLKEIGFLDFNSVVCTLRISVATTLHHALISNQRLQTIEEQIVGIALVIQLTMELLK